ncbi:late embryogenesis abundant protein At1g64065-like [Humulus lupulus]|uniref:late embryogenesis abundant protein At1g64065-like n=1 Tax=Humulus lupulus TaxID=3486 RepID=UPI002B40AD25|nr:late embryogenesis abundant protein At1g64065-like [Humulus lupulus]
MANEKNRINNTGDDDDDEKTISSQYDDELKRNKRIKLAIYIAIFAVFQAIVILVFGLVIMRAKSPKLKLSNIEFNNLDIVNSESPSFDMNLRAMVTIKNPNFGPYEFHETVATFSYGGATVGQAIIPMGDDGMMSTKTIDVIVSLSSSQLSNTGDLRREFSAGTLTLNSVATMTGNVKLMFFVKKKKKEAHMNCTITMDINQKILQFLECN